MGAASRRAAEARRGGVTPSDALCRLTAAQAAAAIRTRTLSPVDLVDAALDRIARLNPRLNAYCTVAAESAKAAASAASEAVRRGDALGPLHGVPVSIKDLIPTAGLRTTFGSRRRRAFVPAEDAAVVARLRRAGAVVLGKTNTSEFGHKAVTDNLLFGPTRNPWNPAYAAGGSSGGAAAAVATGLGPLAVGTDSGGSIRAPASCCGVFGMKPTLGRVAAAPAFGGLETTNHIGPITRTVADAALLLRVMAGPDGRDIGSLPDDGTLSDATVAPLPRGLRVCWSADWGYAAVDPEVLGVARRAAERFEAIGCRLEAAHPGFASPEEAFATLGAVNAAAQFADDDALEGLDPSFAPWVRAGRSRRAVEFVRAAHQRRVVGDALVRLFSRFDLLLTPTLAAPPPRIGVDSHARIAGREVSPLGWLALTFPISMAGCPAASVPCGSTADGLPVGLQIVGPRFADALVLRAAAAFEAAAPWADAWPPGA